MPLIQAVYDFSTDLAFLGRSPLTILRHRRELHMWSVWLDGRDWQAVKRPDIKKYLRSRAHLAASTCANTLTSLRVFYAWAVVEEYCQVSPVIDFASPTRPQPLPRALSGSQVKILIEHVERATGLPARRDEALIKFALYTGLRASELAAITWPMLDLPGLAVNIALSKMGKGRAVKLHADLVAVLLAWGELQGAGQVAHIFSLDGQAIKGARVGKIVRKIGKRTGLPLNAHVLRHSFATHGVRRSGNVYSVSKALGHAKIHQTQIYLSAAIDDSASAVDSLPGFGGW